MSQCLSNHFVCSIGEGCEAHLLKFSTGRSSPLPSWCNRISCSGMDMHKERGRRDVRLRRHAGAIARLCPMAQRAFRPRGAAGGTGARSVPASRGTLHQAAETWTLPGTALASLWRTDAVAPSTRGWRPSQQRSACRPRPRRSTPQGRCGMNAALVCGLSRLPRSSDHPEWHGARGDDPPAGGSQPDRPTIDETEFLVKTADGVNIPKAIDRSPLAIVNGRVVAMGKTYDHEFLRRAASSMARPWSLASCPGAGGCP